MSEFFTYDPRAEHSYRAARIKDQIVGRRIEARVRRRRTRRGGPLDPTVLPR